MKTYLFPGQGSQHYGMGKELFQFYPEFVEKADSILGYSIRKLCEGALDYRLEDTQYTQPALYVVNALYYYFQLNIDQTYPEFMIGNSLGEYNALLAAGVFSFEDGLKLVKSRSALMSKSNGGAMVAVLGMSAEEINRSIKQCQLNAKIQISNYNSAVQHVVSGEAGAISALAVSLKESGVKVIPLNVSGAFHTHYMKEAETLFGEVLEKIELKKPSCCVVSNRYALPYHFETTEIIKTTILEQISNPVLLYHSVQFVLKNGCDEFVEVGSGNSMKNIVAAINQEVKQCNLSPVKGKI